MSNFEKILLRLKEQTGIHTDKAVALLLGISPTAFNDRKKRDAFPEDKLLALKSRRPDLVFDLNYVLTGEYLSVYQAHQRIAQLDAERFEVADTDTPVYLPPLKNDIKVIEKFNRLDESNKSVVEAMIDALLTKK